MNNKIKSVGILSLTVCLSIAGASMDAGAKSLNGADIFQQHCAACHANGGNTVKPSKPVAGSAKLGTLAVFQDYLRAPTGHMPYFKDLHLNKPAMKALLEYCKQLKAPVRQAMAK